MNTPDGDSIPLAISVKRGQRLVKAASKAAGKVRPQFAALPFRMQHGSPEVMLITSRETRRWIIPKGWPNKGMAPHAVAANEAFEEAGLVGSVGKGPIGSYRYEKRLSLDLAVVCKVRVFLLEVEQQLDDWPEMADRERRWLAPAEAARLVGEGGLINLLRKLKTHLRARRKG